MIKVLFVVNRFYSSLNKEFGGTTREFYSIYNSLKDNKEVELTLCTDFDMNKLEEYRKNYDIIHCESNEIYFKMLLNDFYPDVIGPTLKSPFKNPTSKKQWTDIGLNPNDFFKSIVIRNTNAEERIEESWKKINYIRLGVSTEEFDWKIETPKRWVLWAGDVCREAKNFQMMWDIMKMTKLPKGYDWKVLSGYNLKQYLNTLRYTALLINTSFNETFCFAMFEANSCGVPSIYPKGLHNPNSHKDTKEFHPHKRIQVEYTPESFSKKILELLSDNDKFNKERKLAREYVDENASYKQLSDDLIKIYKLAYERRRK